MSEKLCGCEPIHSYYCANCFESLQSKLKEQSETIENMKGLIRELVEALSFYGDEASQIPPEYFNTGRPQADFTAPYRLDKGYRAKSCISKNKELIEAIKAEWG